MSKETSISLHLAKVMGPQKCSKCSEGKQPSCFYKDARSSSGTFSACKECCRMKSKSPEVAQKRRDSRAKLRAGAGVSDSASRLIANKAYRSKYPIKCQAHYLVQKALKRGDIHEDRCEVCGEGAVAHHDDYSKPLDVRWLCQLHHVEWHSLNGPGLNSAAEKHDFGRIKLDFQSATLVAVRAMCGEPIISLAAEFGISRNMPRHIINGTVWPGAGDAARALLIGNDALATGWAG